MDSLTIIQTLRKHCNLAEGDFGCKQRRFSGDPKDSVCKCDLQAQDLLSHDAQLGDLINDFVTCSLAYTRISRDEEDGQNKRIQLGYMQEQITRIRKVLNMWGIRKGAGRK